MGEVCSRVCDMLNGRGPAGESPEDARSLQMAPIAYDRGVGFAGPHGAGYATACAGGFFTLKIQ